MELILTFSDVELDLLYSNDIPLNSVFLSFERILFRIFNNSLDLIKTIKSFITTSQERLLFLLSSWNISWV